MKLQDIYDIYESKMNWVERCYGDKGNPDFWKGIAYGIYDILSQLVTFELDDDEIPKYELLEKPEKINESLSYIGNIEIFNKKYKVYDDDYGQCECIEIEEGNIQSMGAYNCESERSMVYEVLSYLFRNRMKEIENKHKENKWYE